MSLVVGLLVATPAAAQGGAGLYEPFPEPASAGEVRAFMSKLPGDDRGVAAGLTSEELDRGVFPSAGLAAPADASAASGRAGVNADAPFLGGWLVALVALGAAGALAVALARRPA